MRRFILLFIAIIPFTAFTQLVTISETHQIPQIGDTINYQDANTFGFDEEGVGAVTDKVWDFGALMDAGTTIDFWFSDATLTPETASFPNANIVRENSIEAGYFYYETTATDIIRWGWYAAVDNYGIYDNGAPEFEFPITAGGNYNCSYHGEFAPFGAGEDSVVIDLGQIIANADMQGTLTLPTGTFTDVLRIHLIENFHIKAYMLGTPVTDNVVEDDYYYWFVDTILQPILIYGTTDLDGSQQSEVLRYQPIGIPLSVNKINFDNLFLVYPNPTKDVVNVRGSEIERIEVYDVIGKMISSYEVNSFNTKIDLSDNPEGILILKIHSKNNILVKRIVLEK